MQRSDGGLSGRGHWGRRFGLRKDSKRRRRSGRDAIRARILKEFRGIGEPLDLQQNVSKAGDLLSGILRELRLEEGIEERRLREVWQEVAGGFIAKHTEPASLKNGVLTLRVLQPAMRFELEQSRGQLLGGLRRRLGAGTVREVRLTIG